MGKKSRKKRNRGGWPRRGSGGHLTVGDMRKLLRDANMPDKLPILVISASTESGSFKFVLSTVSQVGLVAHGNTTQMPAPGEAAGLLVASASLMARLAGGVAVSADKAVLPDEPIH